MSSPVNTSSHAKALWPGMDDAFYGCLDYDEYEPLYPYMFEIKTSDKAYEEDIGHVGTGVASEKKQASNIQYDDMQQGFLTRYMHILYAQGITITHEMLRDNLYTTLLPLGEERSRYIARSLRHTKEVVSANVYNRSFNSNFAGGDGIQLISTAHVNKSGGTWSNRLAVDASLSEAAIEALCIQIKKLTDDRGLRLKARPTTLHIPVDLDFEAHRILKSVLKNDTANNATNALKNMGTIPEIRSNPYFTSTTAWWVRTNVKHGMKFYQREPATFSSDNDFDNMNLKYKGYEAYTMGWSNPRQLSGTSGD